DHPDRIGRDPAGGTFHARRAIGPHGRQRPGGGGVGDPGRGRWRRWIERERESAAAVAYHLLSFGKGPVTDDESVFVCRALPACSRTGLGSRAAGGKVAAEEPGGRWPADRCRPAH